MTAANLAGARRLLIAIPDGFEAGQIAEQARSANPHLQIIARAHSDAEADHLRKFGADATILAGQELAIAMLAHATTSTRDVAEGPVGEAAGRGNGNA